MSSYAYLYLEKDEIFNWRNDLDHEVLSVFTKDALIQASGTEAIKIVKERDLTPYEGYEEDGDDFSVTLLTATAKTILDRLKVMGYGEVAFADFLQAAIDHELEFCRSNTNESMREYYREKIATLEKLQKDYSLGKKLTKACQAQLVELLEYSTCFTLYYYLNGVPDSAKITLDVSELAYEGWYDESFLGLQDAADNMERISSPPIVLTEGSFDRRALAHAIDLLYPHLSPYIKFFDDTYKAEGGTGAVVKTLKSFAAAGISNRVIALFDNDSAAKEALSTLPKLPANYRVMHYPDIAIAKSYPTIGPQGNVDMDVNGLAASIELYLGTDSLTDQSGNYIPVQWTGYIKKIGTYQGEVLEKSVVQDAFIAKVKAAKADTSKINEQDWSGLSLIIDKLIEELSQF